MTTSPPVEPLISVTEAARRLGMPIRTVYRWVERGHIVSIRDVGGRIGVAPASVADVARRRVVIK
jgi:excisionase family DNA binding protein